MTKNYALAIAVSGLLFFPGVVEAARRQIPSVSGTEWLLNVRAVEKSLHGRQRAQWTSRIQFFSDGRFVEENLETGRIRALGTWRQERKKVRVRIDSQTREAIKLGYEKIYQDFAGRRGVFEFRRWTWIFTIKVRRVGDPELSSTEIMKGRLTGGRRRATVAWKIKGRASFRGHLAGDLVGVDPEFEQALLAATTFDAERLLAFAIRLITDERDRILARLSPGLILGAVPKVLEEAYEPIVDAYYSDLVALLASRWDPGVVDLDVLASLGVVYVIKLRDHILEGDFIVGGFPEGRQIYRDRWRAFLDQYVEALPFSLLAAVSTE